MKKSSVALLTTAACASAVFLSICPLRQFMLATVHAADGISATIAVEYPLNGSIFPPEITPPTFVWRDPSRTSRRWRIDISFADGAPPIHVFSSGERPSRGEIDTRCISQTNELPNLSPEQEAAHSWVPDAGTWEAIKRHSVAGVATINISGFRPGDPRATVSSGFTTIQTSKDQVGAPIFYRDVPLMPAETVKGVISPIAADAVQLIQWRLRSVDHSQSRVVLSGMHTCANCHSFSHDGKTMGMDMDGPRNDKGLYAVVTVKPEMSIRSEDMVNWNPTQEHQFSANRVAFMSQISPDGRYVLSTVTRADSAPENNYYVANFKDYRFLQVFYPTRGTLAWYDRATGQRHPLPGADDPHFVQTDGVWSPDGKYVVFARAEARDPYPANGKMATRANDPNELQIQYDLYRIPFNDGRGGMPEPITGASANGMSNSFPKVSPDGRWLVFVQAHNGQLMRPDSQLYIVPFVGGSARRLNANMSPMNSWHSWSPNGRWLVFSSKSRGPYTRMYLTHIDEQGNDSPAIIVDNVAAANRAVNIPEFVNVPAEGIVKIATPAVDMYKQFDHATQLAEKGQDAAAIVEWTALATSHPDDARVHSNLGAELARVGKYEDAVLHYEKALQLNPQYNAVHGALAGAMMRVGRLNEALHEYEVALQTYRGSADLHNSYGSALARRGRVDDATEEFKTAIALNPRFAEARNNLGIALAQQGHLEDASDEFAKAIDFNPRFAEAHNNLGIALLSDAQHLQADRAEQEFKKAIAINPHYADAQNNLGTLYLQLGGTGQAEQFFRLAIASDPRFIKAYINLGNTLASESRYAEAVAILQKAIEILPWNGDLRNLRDQIKAKGNL